jgi:hypothetical protein
MTDEQQASAQGQKPESPQLSLREYLEISRKIFLAMAAMKGTSIPDCYLRLAHEANLHLAAMEAAVERDANEIAQRYDRQLQIDGMQFWND